MSPPPVLLWFAGYSNLTSIIIVAFCFLAMTIFIALVRMHGDFPSGSSSRLSLGAVQRSMVKVSNPFVVKLPFKVSKLRDGLEILLSVLCDCQVVILWGPLIHPIHDLILKPGTDVRQSCWDSDGELLEGLDCLHIDRQELSMECGQQKLFVTCPATVTSDTLGDMPRKRYPVVVMTFVPQEIEESSVRNEECWGEDPNRIIGLVSMVHLCDDKIQKPSHIISQYVKTAGVPVYSLQSLYLSGGSSSPMTSSSSGSSTPSQGPSLSSTQGGSAVSDIPKPEEDSGIGCDSTFQVSPKNIERTDSSTGCGDLEGLPSNSESRFRQRTMRRLGQDKDSATTDHNNIGGEGSTFQFTESVRRERLHSNVSVEKICDSEEETDKSLPECVVCQTRPVTCALLPCRHACVCLGCFKLLTKCPMCRGVLESYFLLGDEHARGSEDSDGDEEDSVLQELHQQALNQRIWALWEDWNNRLNNFLGFG